MNWAMLTHNPVTRIFALGLTLLLVGMAAWGWMDRTNLWGGLTIANFIGGILTALGSAAQLGTNLAAVHWRRAHRTHGWKSWDTLLCAASVIALGAFTHAGLENAWLISQNRFPGLTGAQIGLLVPIMLWAAPWLEPFLYWRLDKEWDEHLVTQKIEVKEENERIEREANQRRMPNAARDMAREMGRAAMDGLGEPFGQRRPEATQEALAGRVETPRAAQVPRERRRTRKWPPEKQAEVISLKAARVSYREIEERTGVPHESARRIVVANEQKEAA